jgi:hypothetical protein
MTDAIMEHVDDKVNVVRDEMRNEMGEILEIVEEHTQATLHAIANAQSKCFLTCAD